MGANPTYKECSIFKLDTYKSYRNILYSSLSRLKSGTLFQTSWLCVTICYMNLTSVWYWSTSFSASIVILSLTFNECGWQLLPYHAAVLPPYTTDDTQWPAPCSMNQGNKAVKIKYLSVPFLTDHSSIT